MLIDQGTIDFYQFIPLSVMLRAKTQAKVYFQAKKKKKKKKKKRQKESKEGRK